MGTTSLTRYAPLMRDPDPCGPERLAKRLWHDEGTIVITRAQFEKMKGMERLMVEGIATGLYGKRSSK